MSASADDLVPLPSAGRRYTGRREVRLGDADMQARLRLDALARFLQDVANDDAREVLGEDASSWVVRRTVIEVDTWPRFGEPLELTTFCGGTGGRWAERRTSITGARGAGVEAMSLWVHIDLQSGRPVPLPPSFLEAYGEASGGRKVSGRLVHQAPPSDAPRTRWAFRATDYDVLGHVNNAAYWVVVEQHAVTAAGARVIDAPVRYELEYRLPVEPGHAVELTAADGYLWVTEAGTGAVHASVRIVPLSPRR